MSITRDDLPMRQARVTDVNGTSVSVIDQYGAQFTIDTQTRTGKTVGPQVGESWLLSTRLTGRWEFEAKLFATDDDADTHRLQGRPIIPEEPLDGQMYVYDATNKNWVLSPVTFVLHEGTNSLSINVRYADGTTKTASISLVGTIHRTVADHLGARDFALGLT